jgi:hypothetical protein
MRCVSSTGVLNIFCFLGIGIMSCGHGFAEEPRRSVGLIDLQGRTYPPFSEPAAKFYAYIFVRTDCPVANSTAPEIIRLHEEFGPRGVAFRLVYPDPDDSRSAIEKHVREFGYGCPVLRDPQHRFAKASRVRVTPEAALYRADGTLLYHGRIDNRYVDFGKARARATRRDLAQALTDALAGKAVTPADGPAVGCFIDG